MMLLLTVLTFFLKMGTIMCVTIFFSYVYSMFFFMPLLFIMGPHGSFGSIQFIFNFMWNVMGYDVPASKPAVNSNGNGNSNGSGHDENDAKMHVGVGKDA